MNDSSQVKTFFERWARQVDNYYLKTQKPFYWKVLDFLFRDSIRWRFKLTVEECRQNQNAHILDVGCGAGRLDVELAKSGTFQITGIDFSTSMILLANALARQNNCESRCRFILGDFLKTDIKGPFDVSVALGFFDYTENPVEYLKKIKSLTKVKIIASFPAKWRIRNIVRVIRLSVLGCPVYFYTRNQIRHILSKAGIDCYTVQTLDRDYLVVITL